MRKNSEKKTLIAAWCVCVDGKPFNPFVVRRMNTSRKFLIDRDGVIQLSVKPAWFFSTRKRARDFAWQMNAAMRYALN